MATGTLTINEGAGPFHYGDTLTFSVTTGHLQGGHPMVEVCLFQDRPYTGDPNTDPPTPPEPADGVIEMDLFGPDIVGLKLDHPDVPFPLPPSGSTDTALAAKGWARLLNYNRKGNQQQTVDELDRVDFDVEP